ncbi:MAG: class II D-tagatose-bisphosphate aldolase, non-catalytic subunit [Anaerolineales bacterium]|jgi:D-tagatose-1,6-bisphosphate aldolase subunit GatZ/KbaZ
MKSNFLDEIVRVQKQGQPRGIASVCSAHPWVLKAAMTGAKTGTRPLLVESTCNQVNQFGGYTGMTPTDFVAYVRAVAVENQFPLERLILGGDHLGPNVWQNEPAGSAMQKSAGMLRAYVQAGYTKIHLDASMKLGDDDPGRPLDLELSARRTAWLALAAESASADLSPEGSDKLRYIIGSEVPIPGGAMGHEDGVHVTDVPDARRSLAVMQAAFKSEGLESAWERVIALVVQPGVEFGDDFILEYHSGAARHLAHFAETIPFVYEVHSTDFQTRTHLRDLVRDHFAILKVGPALTFAFREAVFALAMMEDELFLPEARSNLIGVMDEAMTRQPEYWQNYYHGNAAALRRRRMFSRSDRIRYYWSDGRVQSALDHLLQNLREKTLPPVLLSQFLPEQFEKVRNHQLDAMPDALILDKINSVLEDYAFACG